MMKVNSDFGYAIWISLESFLVSHSGRIFSKYRRDELKEERETFLKMGFEEEELLVIAPEKEIVPGSVQVVPDKVIRQ